jgi:hypothetical protein
MVTVDLQDDIDDATEPGGLGPDPLLEWPDESVDVVFVQGPGEDPVLAVLWRGSARIVRTSDRSVSPPLRPSQHAGLSLRWSPGASRLWVEGSHGWAAFDLDQEALPDGPPPVGPDLELVAEPEGGWFPEAVVDRKDGTIIAVQADGRSGGSVRVLRVEASGELKTLATHSLGSGVVGMSLSPSGEHVAMLSGACGDARAPEQVTLLTLPAAGE